MSTIKMILDKLKEKDERALITFTTYGYPTVAASEKILSIMADRGVNIIEVGIPYSDPMADGPVIQASSAKALENGVTLDMIFEGIKSFREKYQTPIVLMGYFNSVRAYGFEKFVSNAKAASVDGAIIPDLPLEERGQLKAVFDKGGLDLITMIAPTSLNRVEALSKDTSGFIYCVSSLGVTGGQISASDRLDTTIEKIRKVTDTPLALGFGIKDPKTIEENWGKFDAFIIGSEVLRRIEDDKNGRFQSLMDFLDSVKEACVNSE